ncbi:Putative ATP-dependent RNA helicase T26G10.1 [Aduncisulcus paluster]|uniref:ATP-dependent RNA helicase T26G10.1 n=1 Tax=Aduncisulcus paluster TaxID=2918883 RepID=A0ABQ5KXK2_9EUKA|nr:Putative ATP-dependent RNA helicase T26G10.1 [Aduncisulcus paluster]
MSFDKYDLSESILKAIKKLGWSKPTEIQEKSIGPGLEKKDILGLAPTGSGKTGAFVIPLLEQLLSNPRPFYGLIISPTRELALQIADVVAALGTGIGVHVVRLVGGVDIVHQALQLGKNPHIIVATPGRVHVVRLVGGVDIVHQALQLGKNPHIIVATPGRLIDHLENTRGFNLKKIKYFVLDEADRILADDFQLALEKIIEMLPKRHQTLLFSATLSKDIDELQKLALSSPVQVSVKSTSSGKDDPSIDGISLSSVAKLTQKMLFCPAAMKDMYFYELLQRMSGRSMIIFCSTRSRVEKLHFMFNQLGLSSVQLHGKMAQAKRIDALNNFKTDDTKRILIATDVAARGLDVPNLDVVINYDVANDPKTHIHRIGRTARAGKSGLAITIVTQYDIEDILTIEKQIGKKMEPEKVTKDQALKHKGIISSAQEYATQMVKMQEKRKSTKGKKGKRKGK